MNSRKYNTYEWCIHQYVCKECPFMPGRKWEYRARAILVAFLVTAGCLVIGGLVVLWAVCVWRMVAQ